MVTTRVDLTTKRYLGRQQPVSIIGIHTMEAPEGSQTAENVAAYFKKVNASAHWCTDNDSRVRVVNDSDTAWTLPGANSRSLNIEIAGYAKQTAQDWADEYSIKALEITALCCAEWCIKYNIPVRKLNDAEIRAGVKGFVGHVDISRVYKQSSHWDPGPGFPWAYFLDRVRANIAALGGPAFSGGATIPTTTWNNEGYSTAWIQAQQLMLNQLGYKLDVDGKLGPASRAATKDFQSKNGLDADGIPGPATSAKLASAIKKPAAPAAKPAAKTIDIRPLQRLVKAAADNILGPDTTKRFDALREATWYHSPKKLDFPYGVAFTQNIVGANPDGKWGPKSAAAHDNTVKKFQDALKALGYDAGPTDGKWGPSTEAAYQAMLHAATR